jgi:hypothetical protein
MLMPVSDSLSPRSVAFVVLHGLVLVVIFVHVDMVVTDSPQFLHVDASMLNAATMSLTLSADPSSGSESHPYSFRSWLALRAAND